MKRKLDDHGVAGPISAAAKPLFVPKIQRDEKSALRSRQEDTERIEQVFLSQPRSSIDSHKKPSDSNRHRRASIEKEIDFIKEQYFGSDKPKKRVIIKPSEKFRFSFDWEISDDTSRDPNALYQNPHEARPLFGRGFLAGTDRREQKKVRERLDRHWSEKKLEEMTERDWRIFREDFDISYKGGSKIPRPMRNWAESELTHELLRAVERSGYQNPTRIQMAAVPLGLHQRDIIGIAETGSGKTAAFVLPMLNLISKLSQANETNKTLEEEEEEEGPIALVLAPTRELAQQIETETVKLARYLRVRVSSIVGGRSIEEQGIKIARGCEIAIATPGRLIDCLERRFIVLNRCRFVVLDEADRMTDMGFEPQLVRILDSMAASLRRTTLMFSATMTPPAERLARKYLKNPVVVNIGNPEKATDFITQRVSMVKESEKFFRLKRLLDELEDRTTAIVFVNTKTRVDSVARDLDKSGYRVTAFRGGKSQEQRELSLEGFRAKRFNVLVATDAAGRGIDVPDVGLVVNYDMPGNIQTYTHRIGRTGRAGRTGVAITLLTPNDAGVFYDLKQMLVQSNCHVPRELANHEAAKFKPGTVTR